MLARQGGLCAICRVVPGTFVDHCHATGQVRGVLCFTCNNGLGHFADNAVVLELAALYPEGEVLWPEFEHVDHCHRPGDVRFALTVQVFGIVYSTATPMRRTGWVRSWRSRMSRAVRVMVAGSVVGVGSFVWRVRVWNGVVRILTVTRVMVRPASAASWATCWARVARWVAMAAGSVRSWGRWFRGCGRGRSRVW
ncbi:Phage endonuclease VII [[Actinomadura] parvosata subsp. kistnae]|nr:Phage endonuclease VII [Actinomadura parvosata subsp. kistnae]